MSAIACPSCGQDGKGVKPITLQSLLTVEALAEAGDAEGFRHCATPGCSVAYYNLASGKQLSCEQVTARIGTKAQSAPRPVCYCFGHSWESIEQEIRSKGSTDVVELITAKCKAGEDDCQRNNPQGACCLGNVRRAVKEGYVAAGRDPSEPAPAASCCGSSCGSKTGSKTGSNDDDIALNSNAARAETHERSGLLAAGGAMLAAVLSSTCCWLPLLLVALGAGTSSVAGALEAYRGALLVVTALLLGAGFYFVYFRKAQCAPGSTCETPRPRLRRFNQLTLWLATAMTLSFAAFPSYIGALLDDGGGVPVAAAAQPAATRVFAVSGMTCEGCTAHVVKALTAVPGVAAAEVSYEEARATVALSDERVPNAVLISAIEKAGYAATATQTEREQP